MDPRTAAHVLSQIAAYLELRGESRFKIRAYEQAARALMALETDDLGALDRAGTLADTRGLGPATLSILRELISSGESRYLEQLRADMPAGLLDLLRVPGLGAAKIHLLHESLGIDSVEALEEAARDGRLTKLKGFGPKTAEKILRGIGFYRSSGSRVLHHRGVAAAQALLSMVRGHPDVLAAEIAGSVRRFGETIGDTDIVAACRADPVAVAGSFARAPGVRDVAHAGTASPAITYVDGARLDLHCVAEGDFAVALWRATGSAAHVAEVARRLGERGLTLAGDVVLDAQGPVPVADEAALYARAGLSYVPPEMREAHGEIERAALGPIPPLLVLGDIRGALHCHSTWSDGKATIAEMADASRARGWSYVGVTDHSQSAFYAGGLSRDRVLMQHAEIDALNAASTDGFRVLKGIEADILADGAVDYDQALLDRFDFVVGSVHSRFAMDGPAMTARVLRALDDPHLTVLGHPTGRLLLSRDGYAIDMRAVLEKAADRGVAVEINADPHRLDLDWRLIPMARALGIVLEIGPDAHSTGGLDNMGFGVGMARKGGVVAAEVLNARAADEVLAFAGARRGAAR
jgi:DNA polymerase (family 10)